MIKCHVYIVKYEYDDEIYIKIQGDRDELVPLIASAIVQNDVMKDACLVAQAYLSSESN